MPPSRLRHHPMERRQVLSNLAVARGRVGGARFTDMDRTGRSHGLLALAETVVDALGGSSLELQTARSLKAYFEFESFVESPCRPRMASAVAK